MPPPRPDLETRRLAAQQTAARVAGLRATHDEPGPDHPPPEAPQFTLDNASSIGDLARTLKPVVGQEQGKGHLGVLLSLHLATFGDDHQGAPIPNAILLGPTGVGKTYSMRTLADGFALPFVVVDTTSLVPAGIVGLQIEDISQALYKEAERILTNGGYRSRPDDILRLAERGVVFLDEFDKLATPNDQESTTDASRRQVQRRLLKLAEGSMVRVGVKQHTVGRQADLFLNTSNLLLIAGGAFADLGKRTAGKRRNAELYRQLFGDEATVAEDITVYGFIPELVARFPLIIEFEPLTSRQLVEILTASADSPLKLWERFAAIRGYTLDIEPEALAIIATRASRLNIGARGLQQLLFPYLSHRFIAAERDDVKRIAVTVDNLRPSGALFSAAPVQVADTIENGESESDRLD
jgi:ATP-dependent Clp protease ATP-binding subunit ClpX